jgi:hypothetical protein
MKKITVLCVCFAILVISSCKKDTVDQQKQVSNTKIPKKDAPTTFPEIRDGHLYFASQAIFSQYMEKLHTMEAEEIDAWNKQNGFISNFELINITQEEATSKGIVGALLDDIKPADDILNCVLTPYKEIQIGEAVYQIKKPFILAYKEGHKDEVGKIFAEYQNGTFSMHGLDGKSYSQFAYVVSLSNNGDGMHKTNSTGCGYGRSDFKRKQEPWSDADYKSDITDWWENWWFYKSSGCKSEMMKHKGWWIFGWWGTINAKSVLISWNITTYYAGVPQIHDVGTLQLPNHDVARHTYMWWVFLGGVSFNGNNATPNISGGPNFPECDEIMGNVFGWVD